MKVLNRTFNLLQLWQLRRCFGKALLRLVNPVVFFNLLCVFYSKWARLSRVKGLPYHLMLEPTSRCNLKCAMCARTFFGQPKRAKDPMELATFNAIFRELAPYQLMMAFWNFGEPLLNEDLCEMIRIADGAGIISTLTTNGVLVDERMAERLVGSGLDYIAVSLDAGTPETYQKYRTGGKFESVVRGIEFLSRERRKQKRINPFIEVVSLSLKGNRSEHPAIKALAMRSGADKVSFKKVSYVKGTAMADAEPFLGEGAGPGEVGHSKIGPGRQRALACRIPWEQMVINSDGTVVPCCQDFGTLEPLGNILSGSAEKVWNGKRFQEFRQRILRSPQTIHLCSHWCGGNDFDDKIFVNE